MQRLIKKVIEKDGARFILFPSVAEAGIKCVMTTRDYNTGLTTCKKDEELKRQYGQVKAILGEEDSPLYLLRQKHTDVTLIAGEEGENEVRSFGFLSFDADGLMTDKKNTVTATTVADCIPVIIYDPVNKAISNIHSGWKGTLGEISVKALKKMTEVYGTSPSDCKVFILPHIGPSDFEVRDDVKGLFSEKFLGIEGLIAHKGEGKYLIDLTLAVAYGMRRCGVSEENIFASLDSTKSMDIYHSFRRDGKDFGIMSIVCALDF